MDVESKDIHEMSLVLNNALRTGQISVMVPTKTMARFVNRAMAEAQRRAAWPEVTMFRERAEKELEQAAKEGFLAKMAPEDSAEYQRSIYIEGRIIDALLSNMMFGNAGTRMDENEFYPILTGALGGFLHILFAGDEVKVRKVAAVLGDTIVEAAQSFGQRNPMKVEAAHENRTPG